MTIPGDFNFVSYAVVVFLAVVAAVGFLGFGHYLPWTRWIGDELRPPWTYVYGVFFCLTPLTVGFLAIGVPWQFIAPFWLTFGAGGLTVFYLYAKDKEHAHRERADRSERDATNARKREEQALDLLDK